MTTFFVNPGLGNDALDGTTIANAWATLTTGATAARIAPGDIIKLKKSPDPASIGNATWGDASDTVTLAAALTKTIDRCESLWTASTNVTATRATSPPEGTYSASLAIATAFTTGLIAYSNFSAIDISGYTKITLLLKSSNTLAAGVYSLILSDQNGCANVIEDITISVPLRGNRWIPVVLTLANPANCTAIVSIGLKAISDPGAVTLYADNIEACNDFTHQSLIGKNIAGEPFFSIRSIVGTAVILGNANFSSSSKYYGASELVTTYRRETFKMTAGTSEGTINDSGTLAAPIVFSGGWDFDGDGSQNGETWVDGQSCEANFLYNSSKNFTKVEKVGAVRYNYAFYIVGDGLEINTVYGIGCYITGVYLQLNLSITYCKLTNIFGDHNGSYGLQIDGNGNCFVDLDTIRTCGNSGACGLYSTATTPLLRGKSINSFGNLTYGLYIVGNCDLTDVHTRLSSNYGLYFPNDAMRNFYNANLEETTKYYFNSSVGKAYPYNGVVFMNYLGTPQDDRIYWRFGESRRNSADARSGYCVQMIPNTAGQKHLLYLYPIKVTASTPITVTVYLKASADYNGNNPRMSAIQNGLVISGPTACAVSTSYQQFSLTFTPTHTRPVELIIDCDGTAGSIFADDVGDGTYTDGLENWYNATPILVPPATIAGGGGGYLIDGGLAR